MSKQVYKILRGRDSADGKTFWDKHGVMIIDGPKISIHIDSVPTGGWDGWFRAYPLDETSGGSAGND